MDGFICWYEDGRLIRRDQNPDNLRSQWSTFSSRKRQIWRIYEPEDIYEPEHNSYDAQRAAQAAGGDNEMATGGTEEDTEQCSTPEPLSPMLVDDVAPLDNNVLYIHISTETGHRILSQALRLAQVIFHDTAREHWPEVWQSHFPGGPHEVKFGFSELERCFFGYSKPLGIGRYYGWQVHCAIYSIIDLRNLVCHFGKTTTFWDIVNYDGYVKCVQHLAERVGHSRGFSKAKSLRNMLLATAKRTLDEIESLEPLALLPNARPWSFHHKITFMEICRDRDRDPLEEQPPFLLRAASHWGEIELSRPGLVRR